MTTPSLEWGYAKGWKRVKKNNASSNTRIIISHPWLSRYHSFSTLLMEPWEIDLYGTPLIELHPRCESCRISPVDILIEDPQGGFFRDVLTQKNTRWAWNACTVWSDRPSVGGELSSMPRCYPPKPCHGETLHDRPNLLSPSPPHRNLARLLHTCGRMFHQTPPGPMSIVAWHGMGAIVTRQGGGNRHVSCLRTPDESIQQLLVNRPWLLSRPAGMILKRIMHGLDALSRGLNPVVNYCPRWGFLLRPR
ncbi:hypothetical protein P170DRAFT_140409 [Aspergillus steynii IBT 23096]|uniref:Uncharacterized protein n=1 Tax=Aspergillus steynii IBT 23096 TaxID=1392250 RepID=A0A2I2GBK8_9EURO|nr:uncharacterized protein P170DRAFT_140409 [Aspergillus steynii IBT 23096]PLB50261.1 hypothetical protein P170DRAFT_140409 [Aspergillus steynii IBT 23096]